MNFVYQSLTQTVSVEKATGFIQIEILRLIFRL